jgi:Protein of unknown function (DUF3175)
MTRKKATTAKNATRATQAGRSSKHRWSAAVTETSDSLDLEPEVFKRGPLAIARSLKRSAESSKKKKSTPYRAAMSMLTFYENRAGKHLTAGQRDNLERAKEHLRKLFGRA